MRIRWIYLIPCLVVAPTFVQAQSGNQSDQLMQMIQASINSSLSKAAKASVQMSPAVAQIDTSKTTTLELYNPGKDTVEVALVLSSTNQKADASSGAANKPANSLEPWIMELPKTVTIPPSEKGTVTVKLNVPKNAAAGEYVAWVQGKSHPLHAQPSGGFNLPFASQLVYTVK